MKIAGQRTGETYPEAPRAASGGGSILAIGETINANTVIVVSGSGFMDLGVEIDFVDWTPGDVLIVEYWSEVSQDDEVAVPFDYSVLPLFDVGAGFAQLDSSGAIGVSTLETASADIAIPISGSVSVACPVAPKVQLQGGSSAGNVIIAARSCIMRATRVPASLFVTGPTGVLPP